MKTFMPLLNEAFDDNNEFDDSLGWDADHVTPEEAYKRGAYAKKVGETVDYCPYNNRTEQGKQWILGFNTDN